MNTYDKEQSGQALPPAAESVHKDGLYISGNEKRVYSFKIDQQDVIIEQQTEQSADNLHELHLHFKMTVPARFSVNIWIPDDCRNACVTLNRQLLLSWFAREPRLDLPSIIVSPCAADENILSPLTPGKYQALNFRWQDGDLLVTHMIN